MKWHWSHCIKITTPSLYIQSGIKYIFIIQNFFMGIIQSSNYNFFGIKRNSNNLKSIDFIASFILLKYASGQFFEV